VQDCVGFGGLLFLLADGLVRWEDHEFNFAALGRAHFNKACFDRPVTLVEGDSHQNITKLQRPVNVVFIDAEKEGYYRLFE
jgi:predicted O-methyltransferase YrrM